jgi:hypothetical protein
LERNILKKKHCKNKANLANFICRNVQKSRSPNGFFENPYLDFSNQPDALIFDYFNLLFQEYHRENSNPKALQSLLFLMLTEIQRLFEQQKNTPQTHQLVLFKTFIQLRCFRKWNDCSPSEFRTHLLEKCTK